MMNKILGLLLVSVFFVACGSDDDNGPVAVVKTTEKTHTYPVAIQGIKDQPQEIKVTLDLKDAVGTDIAANLIDVDFQRGKSSINMRGLRAVSETAKIKDLKIKVGNNTVEVGTFTVNPSASELSTDIELSPDKYTDICKYVLEALKSAKDKKVEVIVTCTPDITLTTETSPVYLDLKVSGLYKYNTYPTN